MSAIQKLQQNAKNQTTLTNVVDMSIRHLLAKALKDSGKFDNVNTKMDSRRNALSVKVFGQFKVRNAETIVAAAKKANLTVQVRMTSSGYNETTFKVEQLMQTIVASNVATTQAPVKTLATALAQTAQAYRDGSSTGVVVAGVSLGFVSAAAAAKIRAIVQEDQRPKTQDLRLLNLDRNVAQVVTLPNATAEAIKNQVPSFAADSWTVKATHGIVSVRNLKTGEMFVSL